MDDSLNENQGCLGFLISFLLKFTDNQGTTSKKKSEPLPYRVRDDFLSPAEFSFYKIITSIVGAHISIQCKVRLADVFFVANPNVNYSFFGKISQRHIDFLGCDPKTMKPLFGIELDDSSHNTQKRQKSDRFTNNVFKDAELPLLRIKAQREYNTRDMELKIKTFIREQVKLPTIKADIPTPQPEFNVPICSKCGIPMVLRTVSKGEHKGKQFYGCQNFPQCRELKPYKTPPLIKST